MTVLQQQCFDDTACCWLESQCFSWPHTNETIMGICSTIASCLAVTAEFSGSSLKLISVYIRSDSGSVVSYVATNVP